MKNVLNYRHEIHPKLLNAQKKNMKRFDSN